jgi:CheY-like chemotaxis protein
MGQIIMDPSTLSEADMHLIYGLLLKKRRSRSQDRKVLSIVRSSMELKEKIQAILSVTRVQVRGFPGSPSGQSATPPPARDVATGEAAPGTSNEPSRAAGRKRTQALVIDDKPEITRLLKKCSLKRELSFTRANERFDALHLVLQLRPRLVVVNESFEKDEEYPRYFEICRAIVPGVRLVYLSAPSGPLKATTHFHSFSRFLPKPLNIEKLEEAVRTLLAPNAAYGDAVRGARRS